jgi:hypothetical protein
MEVDAGNRSRKFVFYHKQFSGWFVIIKLLSLLITKNYKTGNYRH